MLAVAGGIALFLGGAPAPSVAGELESGAIAQAQDRQSYRLLHVSSRAGSDTRGDGSQLRPLQTITHALRVARPNTIILLAAGVYSADTGETFPLAMRSGITVQGGAGPNAAAVAIVGGDRYLSPSQGVQHVAILGAEGAGLADVTVSNPHPGGVGLWIESSSPTIQENAFYRSGNAGIFVAGGGTPIIRGNYFSENGSAGLVIAGPSSPQVQGNVFENTGTGISVAPEATPTILNNRITRNQEGLVVHAEARPVLQGNQIVQNRRNSLLDYAAWVQPGVTDLAIPPPPGRSVATSGQASAVGGPGGPVDSEAVSADSADNAVLPPPRMLTPAATEPALPEDQSSGPEGPAAAAIEPPRATLESDSAGPTVRPTPTSAPEVPAAARIAPEPVPASPPEAAPAEPIEASSPAVPEAALPSVDRGPDEAARAGSSPTANDSAAAVAALRSRLAQRSAQQEHDASNSSPVTGAAFSASEGEAIEISVIPPPADEAAPEVGIPPEPDPEVASVRSRLAQRLAQRQRAESTPATASEAVDIPVVPPVDAVAVPDSGVVSSRLEPAETPTPPSASVPPLPTLAGGDSIQVPNFDIPTGSGGMPALFTSTAAPIGDGPPPPPSLASALGLPYRVFVEAAGEAAQREVSRHVPDAFRVRVNGRVFMQAGAYETFEEAQEMVERLSQHGLAAQIEFIP